MKKEYIILTIITISLGVYLYFQNSDNTHYTLPQPGVIEDSQISKIEIVKKDFTISLKKESDEWTIGENKYPAETTKITPILGLLKEIKLTALISESGNYARYELDDASKITLTAWNKDAIVRKIDIGKTASSYKHTFIKLDGNKNVYHADKNLKSIVDKTEDQLVNKTILEFKSESAYSVNIMEGDKNYSFSKKVEEVKVEVNKDQETDKIKSPAEPEEFWASSKGEKKDKQSIETFIKAFSSLECDTFVSDVKKEELTNPVYSVSITTVNKPNTLSVYKSDDETKFICTSSKSAFPFNLSSEKIDKFKELFKKI